MTKKQKGSVHFAKDRTLFTIYFAFTSGGIARPHPPLHPAQLPEAHPEPLPKDLYPRHTRYPAAATPTNPTATVSIIAPLCSQLKYFIIYVYIIIGFIFFVNSCSLLIQVLGTALSACSNSIIQPPSALYYSLHSRQLSQNHWHLEAAPYGSH